MDLAHNSNEVLAKYKTAEEIQAEREFRKKLKEDAELLVKRAKADHEDAVRKLAMNDYRDKRKGGTSKAALLLKGQSQAKLMGVARNFEAIPETVADKRVNKLLGDVRMAEKVTTYNNLSAKLRVCLLDLLARSLIPICCPPNLRFCRTLPIQSMPNETPLKICWMPKQSSNSLSTCLSGGKAN